MLQVFWLMRRLRPNSVSIGSTLRQLLATLQSPQPSQTSSLITTRLAGSTSLPRLRRRRFSVAQVWSYSRIVQPSTSRSSRCTASSWSRWRTVVPGARLSGTLYLSVSSVTITICFAPSASSSRVICGTVSEPSSGCPPVIATASLTRIL